MARAVKLDDFEFDRSVEVLKEVADLFIKHNVKGAVEPIRADEVSLCHTFADAVKIINAVRHKGISAYKWRCTIICFMGRSILDRLLLIIRIMW